MSNHQFNQPKEHAGNMVQDRVSIHIENMLRGTRATSPERSIFRVPHQLREINEKAYEPMFLAIGPYHHGNDKLKYMEDLKPQYLQQLRNREEWSYDRYLPTLRELEQRARNCYAETIDLSQEEFLAMMLIDGCFIVELFRGSKISTNENDSLMDPTWLCYLRRDLLLFENQLPFFVLSKLYDLTKGPYEQHEFDVVAIEFFKREGDFDPNWTNWTGGN